MGQVAIRIRGTRPVPWGRNEWDWRRKVANEGHAARRTAENALCDDEFHVSLAFYLSAEAFDQGSLENLAKPVLDTLFIPAMPLGEDPSLMGTLFDFKDSCVDELALEKRMVESEREEGLDVTIRW